jgi:hypothetical protein
MARNARMAGAESAEGEGKRLHASIFSGRRGAVLPGARKIRGLASKREKLSRQNPSTMLPKPFRKKGKRKQKEMEISLAEAAPRRTSLL